MSSDAKTIVKNEWLQVVVMAVTVAGLFLWSRAESKADYRYLDTKIEINQRETRSLIDSIHKEIRDEMKDFHTRLLKLEERYLQLREDRK